jgi:hypothetical protein
MVNRLDPIAHFPLASAEAAVLGGRDADVPSGRDGWIEFTLRIRLAGLLAFNPAAATAWFGFILLPPFSCH